MCACVYFSFGVLHEVVYHIFSKASLMLCSHEDQQYIFKTGTENLPETPTLTRVDK